MIEYYRDSLSLVITSTCASSNQQDLQYISNYTSSYKITVVHFYSETTKKNEDKYTYLLWQRTFRVYLLAVPLSATNRSNQ